MCGNLRLERFNYFSGEPALPFNKIEVRYFSSIHQRNVVPGLQIPVIFSIPETGGREVRIQALYWGVPDNFRPGQLIYNARSEKIGKKGPWSSAYKKRRALVMASSFCEGGQDFQVGNGGPFAIGAIWGIRRDYNDVVLLTCRANKAVEPTHGRMPLIIAKRDYLTWLDEKTPLNTLAPLLRPLEEKYTHLIGGGSLDPPEENESDAGISMYSPGEG